MIDVLDLALYIVNKCVNEGCLVTNLQLQKVLYYIQVEFLQKKGVLIFEDSIEAWKFGLSFLVSILLILILGLCLFIVTQFLL